MSLRDKLFVAAQYLLPHHGFSRLIGYAADCRVLWFKSWLIRWFVQRYSVDMSAAEVQSLEHYEHFNAFFTRALRAQARPINPTPGGILSPVDGTISQMGAIEAGRLLQAKGHTYNLVDLLGGDSARAQPFDGGSFATLYLSPRDYHRVHMPVAGTLREMVYVPGRLFSVNPLTAQRIPRLFARNERVVCLFDTRHGPMAVVLVGAMIVASIETVWAGPVITYPAVVTRFRYGGKSQAPVHLQQGAELGRFKLGSTVVVMFGPRALEWVEGYSAGQPVQMGQLLARASLAPARRMALRSNALL